MGPFRPSSGTMEPQNLGTREPRNHRTSDPESLPHAVRQRSRGGGPAEIEAAEVGRLALAAERLDHRLEHEGCVVATVGAQAGRERLAGRLVAKEYGGRGASAMALIARGCS